MLRGFGETAESSYPPPREILLHTAFTLGRHEDRSAVGLALLGYAQAFGNRLRLGSSLTRLSPDDGQKDATEQQVPLGMAGGE